MTESRNFFAERVEALFHAALALPPGERTAYLQQEGGGDASLLAEVEALLAAHRPAEDFLEPALTPEIQRELARLKPEEAGERIGPYKLLQQIGEGGFGTVWMAEQEAPVRRRVALKIIKLGMDSREVIARFEQERQALAVMDHPHIAKIFDAGATPHGRPFFVMELVRGIAITEYCDTTSLPTPERLRLFMAVCQAVQHAHQKGIIHRDLKPSNILVTLHDGVPVPKVIDFGVAKATRAPLTERTLFTQFHQMIGTPVYMSPEQAELSGLDIDTRSDIYALGVLLYELLTGRTPFAPEALRRAGYDEIRRLIREQEPVRPSRALGGLTPEALTTVAQRRASDPPRLLHSLRGDLDWVVMKALEKDRRRRYPTAESFAADLQRHLRDEAVEARPATLGYRLGKVVRRHRRALALAATVLAGLLGALVLVSVAYWRASFLARESNTAYQARAVAESAQERLRQQVESLRRQLAVRTGEKATGERLLRGIIHAARPLEGATPRLQVAVAQAAAGLREGFSMNQAPAESLREATLCQTLGGLFWQLGDLPRAEEALRKARAWRLPYVLASDPGGLAPVAETLYSLAVVLRAQGKAAEAEELLQQVLALSRPGGGLDPAAPPLVETLNLLGCLDRDRQQWSAAAQWHRGALALARQSAPGGSWRTLRTLRSLARLTEQQGRPEAGAAFRREADELAARLGPDPDAGSLLDPESTPGR